MDDCVEALVLAAQDPRSAGEVFFAVADRQFSIAEIAGEIAGNIGGKVKFIEWPREREIIEIGDAVITNRKIRETLNWAPRHGLAEGLVKTKAYFSQCLNKYL